MLLCLPDIYLLISFISIAATLFERPVSLLCAIKMIIHCPTISILLPSYFVYSTALEKELLKHKYDP